MTDSLGRALAALPRNSLEVVRVQVKTVAAGAVLTVTLPTGTVVPAVGVGQLTYTVNGYGYAFVSEGALPLVLPV